MAISNELKKLYSSNTVGKRYYHTVQMSHSKFSKIFYLVQDTDSHSWKLEDEQIVIFTPFPFDIKLPDVGSNQQDIDFVFSNIGLEAMQEMEAASELISEPIVLVYRVYMDGYDTAQTSSISLVLTNITADSKFVTATATRPDLFKRQIPSGNQVIFDNRFHGLVV